MIKLAWNFQTEQWNRTGKAAEATYYGVIVGELFIGLQKMVRTAHKDDPQYDAVAASNARLATLAALAKKTVMSQGVPLLDPPAEEVGIVSNVTGIPYRLHEGQIQLWDAINGQWVRSSFDSADAEEIAAVEETGDSLAILLRQKFAQVAAA